MANVQKYFTDFHDAIKLGNFDENADLREKRDTLLKNLREKLHEDVPKFDDPPINQGSYAMHTGTNPKNGNYDIDVGIVFDCTKDKYPDPVNLKKIVRDALQHGNRTVKIRRPCITVDYMKNEEIDYHVDLATYVKREYDDVYDLAMGKEYSCAESRDWQVSDPKGLVKKIVERYDGDDAAQMRRCIRYLKRWRDYKCPSGKPVSIALTCAACYWFKPNNDSITGKYDDLSALKHLVGEMISRFSNDRLTVKLPVRPHNDLLEKMTDIQMGHFKTGLEELKNAFQGAEDTPEPEKACGILSRQFGDEFSIPDKKETAKAVPPPIIPSGMSGR